MGVIDSVVRVVDFVLQGLMLLFVLWYTVHDTKWFARWLDTLLDHLPRRESKSWLTETAMLVIVIGSTYALGLITNAASYVALQPAHESIIETVQTTHSLHVFSWTLLPSPVTGLEAIFKPNPPTAIVSSEEKAHVRSLCEDIAWENRDHEVAQIVLDPLVKQLRVQRGAIICLALLVAVIVIKIAVTIFCDGEVQYTPKNNLDRWYIPWHVPPRLAVLLLHLTLALFLYIYCFQAWTFVEADYHSNVYFGLRTAMPKPSASPDSFQSWKVECEIKGGYHREF